jgi:hypothetical protein
MGRATPQPTGDLFMSHFKAFAISALTTTAIIAVVFRVKAIRNAVTGIA